MRATRVKRRPSLSALPCWCRGGCGHPLGPFVRRQLAFYRGNPVSLLFFEKHTLAIIDCFDRYMPFFTYSIRKKKLRKNKKGINIIYIFINYRSILRGRNNLFVLEKKEEKNRRTAFYPLFEIQRCPVERIKKDTWNRGKNAMVTVVCA